MYLLLDYMNCSRLQNCLEVHLWLVIKLVLDFSTMLSNLITFPFFQNAKETLELENFRLIRAKLWTCQPSIQLLVVEPFCFSSKFFTMDKSDVRRKFYYSKVVKNLEILQTKKIKNNSTWPKRLRNTRNG